MKDENIKLGKSMLEQVAKSNEVALSMIERNNRIAREKGIIALNKLNLGITVEVGEYKVTPFRSIHIEKEESMVFLIEKDGKNYLHLYDTGNVIADVFNLLKNNEIKIDCAVFDCTYGLLNRDYFGHMNLNQVVGECEKFRKDKIFTDKTKILVSHICHWSATHEELCIEAQKHGISVAYDGLRIDI